MSNGNYHLNGWFGRLGERRTIVLCALGALAILTYLPFLGLPPMQDDYLQIQLAERYGGPAGWAGLLQDPLYRCRATSILLTAATVHLFGWSMLAFNLSSMALHALNVLLIAALGSCRWIGWPVSLVAAFVFAVRERHHEAVVWYASLHEPLVLLFSLLSVLSLIKWLEGGSRGWLAASGFAWLAALGSKESGVVLAVVLPAIAWLYPERRRAVFPLLAAGAAVTAAYFMLAFGQRAEHQHFNDGTFSFSTQLARTLLNSAARGLWIWGGLSLAALAVYRAKVDLRLLAFSAAWFLAGLLALFVSHIHAENPQPPSLRGFRRHGSHRVDGLLGIHSIAPPRAIDCGSAGLRVHRSQLGIPVDIQEASVRVEGSADRGLRYLCRGGAWPPR